MADEKIVTSIVANSDFSNLIADVQRVTNSLHRLQQEFAGSNRALAGQIDAANAMFNQTMLKTGQFSSHFVSLTSDVEKFGRNLDSGRLKLKDYFRVYQDHIRTSGGLIRDLAKQQVQLQNAVLQPLGRNAQGLMQYNVHIPRGLDLTKNKTSLLKQELQIMNKVIQDGGVQLINWGKNTQWAGRQLTVGLTLPLVAFGKAAADAFKVADQELTRLTKVYGDVAGTSAQELAKVRKDVAATAKELSSAMGVNFAETISLAADIAATGKTGNELLSSISETTRLAVLGEVDRQEAMKATLAIQSAFKANTEELAESINFLNAVENQTSTTLNDLVEAIPKAGPVIKGLGGSVEDLALYMTAMREGGINASEGANALKSALASLINPTDKAVEKFQGFGIDLLGIVQKNAGSTTDTLFALQAALDRLDPLSKQQAIEQLFGKFQYSRLNALFENLGRQGSQTLQVLDLMKASASELEAVAGRELAAVTESAAGRYKRAIESLRADLAGVGDQFLDIATKLVNVLNKVLDFGQKLPDPIKKIMAFGGAFTAIIGPVIMLTGVLANFFGYIIKGLGHFKALFKGAEGFRLLTPEIIAAKNASSMLSDEFYSDAKAAETLSFAIEKLSNDLRDLQINATKATSATSGLGQMLVTSAGTPIMPVGGLGGPRSVIKEHPLLGTESRAAAHLNPRNPNDPASIFGLTLQPIPLNRKIGRTPQILMSERLPDIEGITSVGGYSTGVVAGEHARYAALMATLGMQSRQEIEALKKTIGLGGQVSQEFIATFDDILPMTQRLTANAAAQSAAIVAELRAGKITAETALARIFAANAELERMMGAEVTAYAVSRGRTIDLTKAPLIDQPVVDVAGKPNTRGMFRTGIFRDVMDAVGRATRTRTFGGPYSIETTRRLNKGGKVPGYIDGDFVYMTNGETVPGPNVNADVVPAMLTPGEFVLTRDVVAQQGSDAVEALHRGEAAIVPFGANKGGRVPGVQYLNTAGAVLARAMRSSGAVTTQKRNTLAEEYAQRVGLGRESSRYYYSPSGAHEDRAHAFFSVKDLAARNAPRISGYFGIASVNKYNKLQNRLHSRFGTKDVNPLTDATAIKETIPDIFTRGGAGNWFAKNGLIDDGVVDAYQIRAFLDHVEDFARTKKWDTKKFDQPPLGFLGLNDPSSKVKITELRDYIEYLMSGKVTQINKHGIILNDAAALMRSGRYTQQQAIDEAEKIYLRAMQDGDDDWSYYAKRMDITETEYPFMIQRKNKGGKIYGFNRGGRVPGYQNGGGVSRAGLLARLGARFNYQGKKYDGPDALQTYKINAMDINGGRKYFGDVPGLSDKGRGALYNATLEFFNSNIIKGDRIDGKRQFVPRHFLTAMPTIAANAITWNKGWLSPEDLAVLQQIKGKGASLGGSASSSMHLKKVYQDVFMANRGGVVPGYRRGGGVVGKNRIFYGDNIDYSRTPFAMMQAGLIPFPGQQSRSGIQTQQMMPMMPMMPGMGAMLGMQAASVGGMFAGQTLGSRFGSGGAMAGSIIGSMLPMMFMGGMGKGKDISALYDKSILSGTKFGQSMAGQAMQGGKLSSTLGRLALGFTKFNVAIAAVTVAAGLGWKAWKTYQDNLERVRQSSGLTQEAAGKLGLKYKSLNSQLQAVIETSKAWMASNKAAYQGMITADGPLKITVAEYKKLRKEVKGTMQDQIELINNTKKEDLGQLAVQLKAMFVAAGMSAEEASKKIYMAFTLSNKAAEAYSSTLGNKGFNAIKDAESAAFAAVEAFNLLNDKTKDAEAQMNALNTAFMGISNAIEDNVKKAEKQADKNKENFDEQKSRLEEEKRLFEDLSKVDLDPIGDKLLSKWAETNPEVLKYVNSLDTALSIMQKMSLIRLGYTGDLSGVTPEVAGALYGQASQISLAVQQQNKKGVLAEEYKYLEDLQTRAKDLETKARGEKVQQQINRRDRIKALEEEIKKINEAADARRQALQEEAEDQDINAEIQKKRLDYQQKLAAGDLGGAAQAQIDLQQAINRQQRTITERQIEERRAADIAPKQAEIDKLNKAAQDIADGAALASENLGDLNKKILDQQKKIDEFNLSVTAYIISQKNNIGNLDILGSAIKRAADALQVGAEKFEKYYPTNPLTAAPHESAMKGNVGPNFNFGPTGLGPEQFPDVKNREIKSPNAGTLESYNRRRRKFGPENVKLVFNTITGRWEILDPAKVGSNHIDYSKWQAGERRYANGGEIRGYYNGTTDGPVSGAGSWTSDSILARLSNGEFVTKASSVFDAGVDRMHTINEKGSAGIVEAAMDIISENNGMLPKFNNGGLASGPSRAARALLGSLSALFPKRNRASDGIMPSAAHMVQNPRSDHNKGLAVDITHDPANGVDAGKLFYSLRKDPRTSYLIFNRKIWNKSIDDKDGAGRRYSGSNPHTAHIHVSILGSMGGIGESWLGAPHDMAMRNQGISAGQSKPEGLQLGENYIVKPGDSLSQIAKRAGKSIAKILQANPNISNDPRYMGGSRIFSGTKVNIPGFKDGGLVKDTVNLNGQIFRVNRGTQSQILADIKAAYAAEPNVKSFKDRMDYFAAIQEWNNKYSFVIPSKGSYPTSGSKYPLGSLSRFLSVAESQAAGASYNAFYDANLASHAFKSFSPQSDRQVKDLLNTAPNEVFDRLGELEDLNKFSIEANRKYKLSNDLLAWCGAFVAWVAEQSGVDISKKMFSAFSATKEYKDLGLFKDPSSSLNVGDIIWWDWAKKFAVGSRKHKQYSPGIPDHVDIITGKSGKSMFTTIGGGFGGSVGKKTRDFSKEAQALYGSVTPNFKSFKDGGAVSPTMGTPDPTQSFLNKFLFGTRYTGGNMKMLKGEVPFGPGSIGKAASSLKPFSKLFKDFEISFTPGTIPDLKTVIGKHLGQPVTIENYFDAIKKGASWPLLTEFPAQEAGGLLNALKVYQKGLGEEIGSMSWDPVSGVISTLNVAKRFRRQGIATELWNTASKLGPVAHSVVRSVAGDDWARKVGGIVPELKHLVPPGLAGGGYINPSYSSNMSIPSFGSGVNNVYSDMIAQVHEKEAIIPAEFNPWNPTASNPLGGEVTINNNLTINASPDMNTDELTNRVFAKVEAATTRALIKAGRDRAI